jgi:hypothetical protein
MQERHKVLVSWILSISVTVFFMSFAVYYFSRGKVPVPQWCVAACEHDGGVRWFQPPQRVVKCNDGMSYGPLYSTGDCTAHGGEKSSQIIGSSENACFCNSGGAISK